jgi:hypothetical protein
MKKVILLIIAIVATSGLCAQVEKGYWMAGGTVSFYAGDTPYEKVRLLKASPRIGYFVIDKLATGLNVSWDRNSVKNKGIMGPFRIVTMIGTGPLVRYYFLKSDQSVNVFTEGSALFGKVISSLGSKYGSFQYVFTGGTNFFLTNSTALELSIGYLSTRHYDDSKFKSSAIIVGIGFQAHLRKS